MQKIKTQKGITLIALIITIIVMLILVAVTLVITLGENGIIAKARTAKEKQALRQEAEKLELGAKAEKGINEILKGGTWDLNTSGERGKMVYYTCPPYYCAIGIELEEGEELRDAIENAILYEYDSEGTGTDDGYLKFLCTNDDSGMEWCVKDYTLTENINVMNESCDSTEMIEAGTNIISLSTGPSGDGRIGEVLCFIYDSAIWLHVDSIPAPFRLDENFKLNIKSNEE